MSRKNPGVQREPEFVKEKTTHKAYETMTATKKEILEDHVNRVLAPTLSYLKEHGVSNFCDAQTRYISAQTGIRRRVPAAVDVSYPDRPVVDDARHTPLLVGRHMYNRVNLGINAVHS